MIYQMESDDLKFVDYRCEDCGQVSEIVIRGDNGSEIKCEKCSSKNMIKIFAPVGFKSGSSADSYSGSSSCSSCSGGSCSTCSR
jgi:putative FmdB family regulatory protein